ncbi:uncharacterized protein LOC134739122 [Pongo pygmaeus]|uniref:uncharacterized protein LOC134739122 n=1 Tax=Pongo pygmaeus TaxID=9600 RepID=UPI00300C13CF
MVTCRLFQILSLRMPAFFWKMPLNIHRLPESLCLSHLMLLWLEILLLLMQILQSIHLCCLIDPHIFGNTSFPRRALALQLTASEQFPQQQFLILKVNLEGIGAMKSLVQILMKVLERLIAFFLPCCHQPSSIQLDPSFSMVIKVVDSGGLFTAGNLKIFLISINNKDPILTCRIGKNYFEVHMESEKSPHCQVNPKPKEQSRRHHVT